jgi:chromosome partitioning protein
MSIPILSFFNTRDGAGRTSLVYHLSWMFAERGLRILAVDLDPLANLTASFLDEEALEHLWNGDGLGAIRLDRPDQLPDVADVAPMAFRELNARLALVPGNPRLASFEDVLSTSWMDAMGDHDPARALRVLTAFWRGMQEAGSRFAADLIVCDIGPNLGALNRAALIASDHVVLPLAVDLHALQGLRLLGPTLRAWRTGWKLRRERWEEPSIELPSGDMKPLGYVAMRHGVRLTRPVRGYTRWLDQIPSEYRRSVLGASDEPSSHLSVPTMADDPNCLGVLNNYASLMPLSQEAGKPMFALRPADGAIGAHAYAAREAYTDFDALAREIATRINPSWAERVS